MAEKIILGSDYIESTNFSNTLELSAASVDVKSRISRIIFETYDGTNWTGKHVEVLVTDDGMTVKKLNGDTQVFPAITYDALDFQSLLDKDAIVAFLNTYIVDYTQGS